jgi:non-specific serine/threonine protein kinase
MPIASIAERLDQRFALLRRGHRLARPHHETLRASIHWSVDLLSEEEHLLFRRLGAFRGEFDVEAAEAVCGHEPLDRDDVLDLLARLVEKSLVQQVGDRYVMLDSIRDFARELIYEAGERESLGATHLAHYTAVVEASAQAADGPEQGDRLDADLGDIRSAVEFALERSHPAALRLGSALGQWGFVRNRLGEVARWCIDAAEAAPEAPPAVRARALTQAGFAFVVLGSPARGIALVDDGLALARSVDDRRLLLETLLMAADLRLESGQVVEAGPLAREALAVARGLGEAWLLGRATFVEARADEAELGYKEAHRRLDRARGYFERAADSRQVARVLMTMAFMSVEAGALAPADAEAQACVEICTELEHAIGRAVASTVRIWVAIDRRELDAARELLSQVFQVACASGYVVLLGLCAATAAELRQAEGNPDEAARLLGALEANADALGGEGASAVRGRTRALREALSSALGEERMGECLEAGSVVPLVELSL